MAIIDYDFSCTMYVATSGVGFTQQWSYRPGFVGLDGNIKNVQIAPYHIPWESDLVAVNMRSTDNTQFIAEFYVNDGLDSRNINDSILITSGKGLKTITGVTISGGYSFGAYLRPKAQVSEFAQVEVFFKKHIVVT